MERPYFYVDMPTHAPNRYMRPREFMHRTFVVSVVADVQATPIIGCRRLNAQSLYQFTRAFVIRNVSANGNCDCSYGLALWVGRVTQLLI